MKTSLLILISCALLSGCCYFRGWHGCKPGYKLVSHGCCEKINVDDSD